MTLLRVLTAVFVLICLAITVVILLQEGKLEKATKVFVVLFFVIAIVLNMKFLGY